MHDENELLFVIILLSRVYSVHRDTGKILAKYVERLRLFLMYIQAEFHIYRHLLNRRKPNACSIHRLVWAPLLVFALNCILNVLVVLVRLDTMDGIQLFHVRRNSVVRIPLNSLEYCSNCRNIGLCIHTFHCRYNAFFLYFKFLFRKLLKWKRKPNKTLDKYSN